MGDLSQQTDLRFDLGDLGLLGPGHDREADIIVRHTALVMHLQCCAFLVADHDRGLQVVRGKYSANDVSVLKTHLPLADSIMSELLETNKVIDMPSVRESALGANSAEAQGLPLMSYLAAPVHGPAGEPIGALTALSRTPLVWGPMDRQAIKDGARLLSRHVLLKAALATIKLMSKERASLQAVGRWAN